jgi:ABC-type oligopeptide transport system ATPase subunit
MKELLMDVKGLKKYFPIQAGILRRHVGDVKALDGVDFVLHKGEVLGVVGETGSGKSTLGRTLLRLLEPTGGSITFLGKDFLSLSEKELKSIRAKMQMVFQDPSSSLNPRKTVGDSVGEALLYHNLVLNKKEQQIQVADIFQKIGLPADAVNRYPHQFSGGQQQRICIGRALALNPQLIVLDEPLSALDVSVQAQIMNLLIELQQSLGLTYLFISHDLGVVRHICDRVLVLYKGKIVETGSVDEVFNSPKHPYTIKLLSSIPKRRIIT